MTNNRRCDCSTELPNSVLVDLVADGDTDAFALIAQRYGAKMYAVALQYTRNPADADDAIQEALTHAWQKITMLRNPDALGSWLLTLTARKAIDLVRARRAHAELSEQEKILETSIPAPDTQVIINEKLKYLDRALRALPQDQAQVWTLRYGAGMSYFEIGRELRLPTTTVRGRLARARQSLLAQMEEWT